MATVFITAFEPYDRWSANSSWLALVELLRDRPNPPVITTRRYPVDFQAVQRKLREDLQADYDVVLHLGQAPGSARIQLEQIAINVGGSSSQLPDEFQPLLDGPVGYRSALPLADWSRRLRAAGLPVQVSYHAGSYLCNATMYYTHHLIEQLGLKTQAAFVHFPLEPSQVLNLREMMPTLSAATAAQALRLILQTLA
ncbi:MAG TPA: pyroglutamyl-peptidase I [Pirellulales bacterium]|jgi:pyroglutamyl-peptidase|nr:pyroglutamyl-peptidase I [Pirellulales bacterium]